MHLEFANKKPITMNNELLKIADPELLHPAIEHVLDMMARSRSYHLKQSPAAALQMLLDEYGVPEDDLLAYLSGKPSDFGEMLSRRVTP